MGGGFYDYRAHSARTEVRAAQPVQRVFTQTSCHPLMDPRGVMRESCDSSDHPSSIAILFGVDVTGSMGGIPVSLAQKTLPTFMRRVLSVIPHPQVCFYAVGDANDGDLAPLQIGQFESSDSLMDEWLTRLFLEGAGGPNGRESYELGFFLAARRTKIDCMLRRGQKGYHFLTGDEAPYDVVRASVVNRLFGPGVLSDDVSLEQIVAEASESYHNFFLIPDSGRALSCERVWRNVLGDRVVVMNSPQYTSETAAVLIGLTEHTYRGLDDVRRSLEVDFQIPVARDRDRILASVEAYAASIGFGND